MLKKILLAPGPTPVPPQVLLDMAQPIMHHRTSEFSAILDEVAAGLKALYQTEQQVLILAASGTGAMEAAVANLLAPGEKALVVVAGKFGQRWRDLVRTYGHEAVEIEAEWGRVVTADQVGAVLDADPAIRAVFMQGCETSTATRFPVEEVAAITRERDVLLVVDGITAVGAWSLPMDELGIDCLICGSQKALMLPPGLATIALSERARERIGRSTAPRYYLDLAKEHKAQAEKSTTAYTPAVSLVVGLRRVLRMMREETFDGVYARHALLARAAQAGMRALGLELLSEAPSPSVTAAVLPEGFDGAGLVKYMREELGVTMAGGQDHLKGKIVRMGHLGYVDAFDILTGFSTLGMALRRFGHEVRFGAGVGAAEEILLDRCPQPA